MVILVLVISHLYEPVHNADLISLPKIIILSTFTVIIDWRFIAEAIYVSFQ